MRLHETVRKEMARLKETEKTLDLDAFGAVMDEFIQKSAVGLMVTKEENSTEWTVQGAGCGAVMDFYIFLNALRPLYLQMLEQMKGQLDAVKLADTLAELFQEELRGAAAEAEAKESGKNDF